MILQESITKHRFNGENRVLPNCWTRFWYLEMISRKSRLLIGLLLGAEAVLDLDEGLALGLGEDEGGEEAEEDGGDHEEEDRALDLEVGDEGVVELGEDEREDVAHPVADAAHPAADLERVELEDHEPGQGVDAQAAGEDVEGQPRGRDPGVAAEHGRVVAERVEVPEDPQEDHPHAQARERPHRLPTEPVDYHRGHRAGYKPVVQQP